MFGFKVLHVINKIKTVIWSSLNTVKMSVLFIVAVCLGRVLSYNPEGMNDIMVSVVKQ